MKGLYVLGGRQRRSGFKEHDEWETYESALILQADPETGEAHVCVEYRSPLQVRASAESSVLFKTGALQGDVLYTCTSTEVLAYRLPRFELCCYVSLPCFNDLHHACPSGNGDLWAASTGLDMVVEFTPRGKILRQWNVLGEDPWGRFSKEIDYRRVATTKPHRSHPNYVFQLDGEIWVTRHDQRDALCLTRSAPPIVIGIEKPHDGIVKENWIYFTTVDGNVVVVDRKTLKISHVVDLKVIGNERRALLGWCRGLLVLDETKAWVGFTRVRKTKFKENLSWVKHAFHDVEKPTHIALYDLSARKLLREINLEPYGVNVVFGILKGAKSCATVSN